MKKTTQTDINAIARLLSRAFYNDPLFSYFFPDATRREQQSFYTFRFLATYTRRQGVINTTPDTLQGAALWLPSQHLDRGLLDMLRFGALRMVLPQGSGALARQLLASDHMQAIHSMQLSGKHWYLSLLGVEPNQKGKGLATGLLRPMLEQADEQGLPCYLDTHNPNNVSLYQRFGFKVAYEGLMPGSHVQHWAMLRQPR